MKRFAILLLAFFGSLAQAQTQQVIERDTFTRANSANLGANWTANSDAITTGTLGIVSNTAQPSVGGNAASFWSANSFTANQYSQVLLDVSSLTTNTHGGGPTVHDSAAGYYRFFCNDNNISSNCQVAKVVSGAFTNLGSFTVVMASGDLLRLEIVGTTLTAFHNGTVVFGPTSDTSLTTGSPGICGFMAASSPTASMVNWEGGNLVWTRQGTVITQGVAGGTQEPSVLYDTNPQVLSANADGHIFKMWFTNGWLSPVHMNYAESANGTSWTPYGSNPVISDGSNNTAHSFVFRNGSGYQAFTGNDLGAGNGTSVQIDLWASANGVTSWSVTSRAVIATVAATWESLEVDDPYVWIQGSTCYMLYQGRAATGPYSVGLATASAPACSVWTKSPSNPVITGTGDSLNGKTVVITGSTYYLYGGTSPASTLIPTDISIWKSTNLTSWTPAPNNPVYIRVTADEGPNSAQGQVADAATLEPCAGVVSCSLTPNTTWMFYDALPTQGVSQIHINAATAPFSLLPLTQSIFGDPVTSGSTSGGFIPMP